MNGRIPPNMFIQLHARHLPNPKLTFIEMLEFFDFVQNTGVIQDCIENVN